MKELYGLPCSAGHPYSRAMVTERRKPNAMRVPGSQESWGQAVALSHQNQGGYGHHDKQESQGTNPTA